MGRQRHLQWSIFPLETSLKYSLTLPLGKTPVEKKKIFEMLFVVGGGHLFVFEINQDNYNSYSTAQRSAVRGCTAHHSHGSAERKIASRNDETVIQSRCGLVSDVNQIRYQCVNAFAGFARAFFSRSLAPGRFYIWGVRWSLPALSPIASILCLILS